MADSITVREFQKIVDASVVKRIDSEGFVSVPHRTFEALEEYVLAGAGKDSPEAQSFMTLGASPGLGKTICAKNYVGVISLHDGTQISILPKLAASGEIEDEYKILLRMLNTVLDLPIKEADIAHLNTGRVSVFDMFARMFADAAILLGQRGLRGAYCAKEGNERFLRGKLIPSMQCRLNAFHGERFYVRYDEFTLDRPENRLIKTTLLLLERTTKSLATKRELSRAVSFYSDVSDSCNVERDFASCHIDRTMKSYRHILGWCSVFLRGKSFTPFEGDKVAFSFLFPMEMLFERYVAQLVKRAAGQRGWKAFLQDGRYYLYSSPKKFQLRPDIVLQKSDESPSSKVISEVILDTKWKRLKSLGDLGIVPADVYQMYVYQCRYHASKSILVYPSGTCAKTGKIQAFESKDERSGRVDAYTEVFAFNLEDAVNSAEELVDLAISAIA